MKTIDVRKLIPSGGPRCLTLVLSISLLSPLLGCGSGRDPIEAARDQLSAGKPAKAVEILQDAVEADRSNSEYKLMLGMALLQNRQPGLAVWPLRRAAETPDQRTTALFHLALALYQSRNGLEAARVAEELLDDHPNHWRALRLKINAHVTERQWDHALQDLERLIDAFPEELALYDTRINGLLAEKRFDEASEELAAQRERAASRSDVSEDMRGKLCVQNAVLLSNLKEDVGVAREQAEDCLAQYHALPSITSAIAQFFDGIGDTDRATGILEEAIANAPDATGLKLRLAARFELHGDTEAAVEILQAIAEQSPSVPAQLALRDFWIRMDDLEAAVRAVEAALELETQVPAGSPEIDYSAVDEQRLFSYIDLLAQVGEFDRIREMKNSIEEPVYHDLLDARIAYEQGDFATALREWNEAFARWPSNAGARYLAAQAALEEKDFPNAINHLRESLRTNASLSDAGLILTEIHLAEGDLHRALNSLSHHIRGHPDDLEAQRKRASLAALLSNHKLRESIRVSLADNFGLADEVIADQAADIAAIEGPETALEYLEESAAEPGLESGERNECLRAWWQLMESLGRGEEAAARIARVAANYPENADLQSLLATSARASGELATAGAALARALELDPQSARAQLEAGHQEALAGNIEAALEAYDRAADIDADDPAAHRAAIAALVAAEDFETARERLLERLGEKPWDGTAAHTLASLAVLQERPDDLSIEMARRALRFPSGMGAIPLVSMGQLRLLRGEGDAAVNAFQTAMENGLSGPTLLYWLGRAHAAAGARDRAIEALRAALESGDFPEAEAAAQELAALQEMQDSIKDSESG